MNLLYLADIRMPTEKAHGLQIAQMCEAFARANCEVTLLVPKPRRSAYLTDRDPWEFYGVQPIFKLEKLWTIHIAAFLPRPAIIIGRMLHRFTFYLSLFVWLKGQPADAIIYSRDVYLHWWLRRLFADRIWVYESHRTTHTPIGLWVQRQVLRSSTLVVALTKYLANELEAQSDRPVLVEHDGFRAERFANMPSREEARAALGIPRDLFVSAYLGQLETLGMDKGVGTLVEACRLCYQDRPGWSGGLMVIGGPAEKVELLRQSWAEGGMPLDAFYGPGQVAASDVPLYLAACNVCVMPHPRTEFFAYHTSPLKLFEYMAAGRAILATDMPVFHEVLAEGENAVFVPPSDPHAMRNALFRLADDTELCNRLARNNQNAAKGYTWEARAHRIRRALESLTGQKN